VHINAMGADAKGKQELAPAILWRERMDERAREEGMGYG